MKSAAAQTTPAPDGRLEHRVHAAGHSRYSHLAGAMSDPDARHELIARAAYFRAKRRGFVPGRELEDWLAAEAEIDTGITLGMYC